MTRGKHQNTEQLLCIVSCGKSILDEARERLDEIKKKEEEEKYKIKKTVQVETVHPCLDFNIGYTNDEDLPLSTCVNARTDSIQAGLKLLDFLPKGERFKRVYAGTANRATSLAGNILEVIGQGDYGVCHDPRLNKQNLGQYWNMPYQAVEALYRHEASEYHRFKKEHGKAYCYLHFPPAGQNAESLNEVASRVANFNQEVLYPSTENILVVTHFSTALAFQLALEGDIFDAEEIVAPYLEKHPHNCQILAYCRQRPVAIDLDGNKQLLLSRWKPCKRLDQD